MCGQKRWTSRVKVSRLQRRSATFPQESRIYATLAALKDASTKLLQARAKAPDRSRNVAIFSHYPDWFQENRNLRNEFLEASGRPLHDAGAKVMNFFGHTHAQKCIKTDASTGECTDFLTGGSGGCCGKQDLPAGFVAVSFAEVKGIFGPAAGPTIEQQVECFVPDPRCTLVRYQVTTVKEWLLKLWRGGVGKNVVGNDVGSGENDSMDDESEDQEDEIMV